MSFAAIYKLVLTVLISVYGFKLFEAAPCFYNNQVYQQNETWRLNCKQSCRCEGGDAPVVKCFDHCLLWLTLPRDCKLEPPAPGKCCPEPSCPEHVQFSRSKGYVPPDCPLSCREEYIAAQRNETESKPTIHEEPTCVYNNKTYNKGETWIEDCKQSCTCVGGGMGFVRCRDLCLQWNHLPSVCKIKPPAPGKCCPEPDCPAYMQLQYPPWYKPPDCPASCHMKYTVDNQTMEKPITEKSCSVDTKVYAPGEMWISPDCQQNCTCDGVSGQAECRNICLQWPTLPLECKMTPPDPGKCCPEPVCPSYIYVRYPTGYVPPDCPLSCSSADITADKKVPGSGKPGSVNHCSHNNKKYVQGETWIENCEKLCTCANSTNQNGYVSCHELCLEWPDLPAECDLKPPEPGKCCPEPSCPAPYSIKYPPGYTRQDCPAACYESIMAKYRRVIDSIKMGNTCWYKNRTYTRGESWLENCKQQCVCVGGANGFIRCRDLCLNWNNLPAACHMKQPVKGKCCPEPVCPSYITLQFPPGYVSPDCPETCNAN